MLEKEGKKELVRENKEEGRVTKREIRKEKTKG